MEHLLKNGKTVIIRKAVINDAKAIIDIISTADTETKFLARNPGEFTVTEDEEKNFIENIHNDSDREFFVAQYDGKVIGNCYVGLISKYERCRHRAEVAFVILKDYWGLGIGKKLMIQCIDWCANKHITQIELDVVSENQRAIELYKKFGFNVIGTIPNAMHYLDGSFADKTLMVLEL